MLSLLSNIGVGHRVSDQAFARALGLMRHGRIHITTVDFQFNSFAEQYIIFGKTPNLLDVYLHLTRLSTYQQTN